MLPLPEKPVRETRSISQVRHCHRAAEGLELSKAQTVERILGQYLAHQGILTEAEWPAPKPPATTYVVTTYAEDRQSQT